jgi:DNA-binding transcriptional LysR family regulator
LHEGHAARSLEWLAAGLADFSLSSIPREPPEGILFMPCGELHWSLLTLPDHPLLRLDTVSLADIARWPLITYESDYGSRTAITRAFTQAGEKPDIVMSAGNADAMRQYVLCGLGIAIVARSPREHEDGNRLQTIDIRHLIPSGRFYIGIRRAGVLGEAAKSVIGLLAPDALGQLASSGAGIA